MNDALAAAFEEVADQFIVTDEARPGEWTCRLCCGQTIPGGPVIHTPRCSLSVLYEALEATP